ncbi:phosphoenolpyruvate carboxylase [Desulfocapsa sulfexigens DSM 10523]|uniref:Phosphoenolpyruvate carboxylase n=1 Tax=Desulfocapsa sulfexigens (strain DSM 10523 / SB164P1) TaxID=1167006 RepID=M1P667_DESSD|nr:phosphoenolpyruvate carboxylase [Desulfocapsa sulfexigens]AGF77187.1 phosphoenolpyruvate carboxylase [Desulfocapsa sulfexigens DSM 10523]
MAGPRSLVLEIHNLTEHLYRVLQEQVGVELTELVEHVFDLAKARRAGDIKAAHELGKLVADLDERQAEVVLTAASLRFDLVNMAEDRQRVRMLRDRERRSGHHPRPESISAAIAYLGEEGYGADQVQGFLDKLSIEPVFTAHPTEAKRRTVRAKLKRIQQCLAELNQHDLLPREEQRLEEIIHCEIVALWQTEPHRPERPTVIEEVERALFFMQTLWDVVPRLYQELEDGLGRYFYGNIFSRTRFLHFGSWIGGDRDGNPFVTSEVTAQTLTILRQAALDAHLQECRQMYQRLSMSMRKIGVNQELVRRLAEMMEQWPQMQARIDDVPEQELYRRWLRAVEWRLHQSRIAVPFAELPPGAYQRAAELLADIELVRQSLWDHDARDVAENTVTNWLCRIRVFGFHMACLDIRQESGDYEQVVAELLACQQLCSNYMDLDEQDRQDVLCRTMGSALPLEADALSDQTREALALFRLLTRTVHLYGPEVLGGHVISMTHQPSHVLLVLWLLRWAAVEAGDPDSLGVGPAGIVPLFETIDDLKRSATIMEYLLENKLYKAHLTSYGRTQTIMVGYSDSTKDGGYLEACWSLYRGQSELYDVCRSHGVKPVFFHGRGGSLGRGGGPAARSIMSLPPHTVAGAIRMTEQGEVLAARYDDPEIAFRHLEQVTAATILVEAEKCEPPRQEWLDCMESLAARAYEVYRDLVEQPGFVDYFRQTTPIDEIESLPIGSRPSRRKQNVHSLETLRAIPWVFAWTQSRVMIPAWYGLGTAMVEFAAADEEGWQKLNRMYQQWAFFKATVDNAEQAVAKASPSIAHIYSQLAENKKQRRVIWDLLVTEYDKSCKAVLYVNGSDDLLEVTSWLARSIEERDPYVDPLNLIQVELIKRGRQLAGKDGHVPDTIRVLIRQSIQGMSASMRTTG